MIKLDKDTWKRVKIGDVADIVGGGTPSRAIPEYFNGDIPWIGPTEISKIRIEVIKETNEKISLFGLQKSSAKLLPIGSVLLTTRAKVGEVAIAGCEMATSQSLENFICDEKEIRNWYLAYWLHGNKHVIHSLSAGTTFKGITRNILAKIEIPLPPLDAQQRIVELFQSVEQGIIHAEGQENHLKLLQKALSNGLASNPPVFGNLLSKKNCKPCSFGNITECVEEHDKTPLENGLTRFVGLENIESENFVVQGFGDIEDGTTFTKRFSKGDVLFGKRRAYLRKVAVADYDGICSSDILVFRAIQDKVLSDLLPYYVSSDVFMNLAISTSAGSLSPRTKWRDLEGFQLSIPDIKIQEKIVDVMNQLSQSLQLIIQQKETLKKLKQKLLHEILG